VEVGGKLCATQERGNPGVVWDAGPQGGLGKGPGMPYQRMTGNLDKSGESRKKEGRECKWRGAAAKKKICGVPCRKCKNHKVGGNRKRNTRARRGTVGSYNKPTGGRGGEKIK